MASKRSSAGNGGEATHSIRGIEDVNVDRDIYTALDARLDLVNDALHTDAVDGAGGDCVEATALHR